MTELKIPIQTLDSRIKKLNNIYGAIAFELDLPESSFWILYIISDSKEELSQDMVYREWAIPKQTINSAVRQLEKRGFIFLERIRSPGSCKQQAIKLTADGQRFVEETIIPFKEAERRYLDKMSEKEKTIYFYLLEKHISCLQKMKQTNTEIENETGRRHFT